MLTYAKKEEAVAELKEKFGRASSVILADYRGVDVESVNALRTKLHAEGQGDFEYQVVKNSILRRAAEGSATADLNQHFQGPTAVAISFGDPVGLAKALVDFADDNESFELKAGVVDGKTVDTGELATLAKLPSLDALRGKLVGLLQAPAQKIAAVVQAPAAQLARLVDARRAQLEDGGEA